MPNDEFQKVNSILHVNASEDQAVEILAPSERERYFGKIPDFLPIKFSLVNSNKFIEPDLNFNKNKVDFFKNNPTPVAWKISVVGGVNKINFNYSATEFSGLAGLKKQAESGEWGISLGAHAAMLWKDKWLLNSGVEYHESWSEFEFEQEKPLQILKENQLLKLWVDGVTGDTIDTTYEDTFVDAVSTRNVVHHNKYQQFTIPVEVGVQQDFGKLIYGATVGATFNFMTSQSGKALDGNVGIVAFEKDSPSAPFKSFNVGFRLSPIIGYRVSNNWAITLHPQWTLRRITELENTVIKMDAQ